MNAVMLVYVAWRLRNTHLKAMAATARTEAVGALAIRDYICENALEGNQMLQEHDVGDVVVIKTVTIYYIGRIKKKSEASVVLEECTYISNTREWGYVLLNGEIDRGCAQPGPVEIMTWVIVAVEKWLHPHMPVRIANQ